MNEKIMWAPSQGKYAAFWHVVCGETSRCRNALRLRHDLVCETPPPPAELCGRCIQWSGYKEQGKISKRDPRTDPQEGDVLRSRLTGYERVVIAVEGRNITYLRFAKGDEESFCCVIATWRDWCRTNKSEVVLLED